MHRGAFSEDDDRPQRSRVNFRNKLLTSLYRLLLARRLITRGTRVSSNPGQSSHPADSLRNWHESSAFITNALVINATQRYMFEQKESTIEENLGTGSNTAEIYL